MQTLRGTIGAGAAALLLLGGCGAARDIKDAANGLKNAEKDSKELEARVARSKEIIYTATYEIKSKDGKTEQTVVAQKPPKAAYTQGETQLIDDGQRVVTCSKTSGKAECTEVGPHTDAGIYGVGAGFAFAFNPATFIGLYTTAAILPGVEAGKSTRDVAGQKSECVSIKITRGSDSGKSFEGCTTDDGIFTFSDDGEGNVVTMTKFDKQASDSLFTPPAKVRTQQDIINEATSTTEPSRTTSSSSSSTSSSSTSTSLDTTSSSSTSFP